MRDEGRSDFLLGELVPVEIDKIGMFFQLFRINKTLANIPLQKPRD